MKVSELFDLFHEGCCFDTYDTVYDVVVTWTWSKEDVEDEKYPYFFKMTKLLASKLDIACIYGCSDPVIEIEYTKFIKGNLALFREFAQANWLEEYIHEDDDDFVYQFINELHGMLAGEISERVSKEFCKLLVKAN